MPSNPGRADRLLEDALAALVRALDESKAPWAIIGGVALIARGVRRFTTDVDAAVRGDAVQAKRLAKLLAKHAIAPRIADALGFAEENLVLLVRHAPTGVDIDLSFAWSEFEHEALAVATRTRFGTVEAPMCLPESLIVFKAIAGRPKDLDDMAALLELYPDIDHQRVRRRVAELATLAEAPEMLRTCERLLAQVSEAAPEAGASKARPKRSRVLPKKRRPKPER